MGKLYGGFFRGRGFWRGRGGQIGCSLGVRLDPLSLSKAKGYEGQVPWSIRIFSFRGVSSELDTPFTWVDILRRPTVEKQMGAEAD